MMGDETARRAQAGARLDKFQAGVAQGAEAERAAILAMVRERIEAEMREVERTNRIGDEDAEEVASGRLSLLDALAADIEARGEG